eukprot:Awhi_evm1s10062
MNPWTLIVFVLLDFLFFPTNSAVLTRQTDQENNSRQTDHHINVANNIKNVEGTHHNIAKRIVGGHRTSSREWLVSLRYNSGVKWKNYCGATVINDHWLITAAHCVSPSRILNSQAWIGNTENDKVDIFQISDFKCHEDFDEKNLENDICLLKLNRKIEESIGDVDTETKESFGVVLMDSATEARATLNGLVGVQASVFGWGQLTEKGPRQQGTFDSTLHAVSFYIVEDQECIDVYSNQFKSTNLCAGYAEGGKDSCQGDSGGPLMLGNNLTLISRSLLIGLVSFGTGCGRPDTYGSYTRVASYIEWIRNQGVEITTASETDFTYGSDNRIAENGIVGGFFEFQDDTTPVEDNIDSQSDTANSDNGLVKDVLLTEDLVGGTPGGPIDFIPPLPDLSSIPTNSESDVVKDVLLAEDLVGGTPGGPIDFIPPRPDLSSRPEPSLRQPPKIKVPLPSPTPSPSNTIDNLEDESTDNTNDSPSIDSFFDISLDVNEDF